MQTISSTNKEHKNPRKPKRKDTQIPQSSDPSDNVADEAVHKELGDSLVRAATTASSLEAEQDSGNITKKDPIQGNALIIQSQGTNSGGGHRCQETMGDTIAQTRILCDEESLGEDASKQGRIDVIDADEEITLVSAAGDKVSTASTATTVSAATTTTAIITTVDDITLAQALEEMKSNKTKAKRVVIQELEPVKKKDQILLDEETALNLQAEFDEEERLAREKAEKEQEANIALIETWDDIQAKIDVDHQLAERLQMFDKAFKRVNTFKDFRTELVDRKEKRAGTELAQEITKKQKVEDDKEIAEIKKLMEIILDEEEVAIDAIPLAVKSPSIVDWKIHKEGRKSYYQIIRADGKSQMYMIFSHMLKSFDREDLETLYKLVKAKYESTRPVEDLDLLLWGDLKTMFEPHVEDKVWRNQQDYKVLSWKLYDSCGVHFLRMQHMQIYMLVEKKYPLTPSTLSMMLEKKLMIDYESEMAYQLLKFIIKQLKK
ncbi:hypothetical protein Tco_1507900 [Tanacetum coccineum]